MLAAWLVRACWAVILMFTLLYILHAAIYSEPQLAAVGGLSTCFYCVNGWMWHVLMMTLSYPVAMVEAYLAIAAPVSQNHSIKKSIHVSLHSVALICWIAGIVAMASSKFYGGKSHFYSVHSWAGLLTVLLSIGQYGVGLASFLLFKGQLQAETRAAIMVYHRLIGKLTIMSGVATCVLGWTDMQTMLAILGMPYYSSATMLGSATGIVTWILLGALFYLFSLPAPSPHSSEKRLKVVTTASNDATEL